MPLNKNHANPRDDPRSTIIDSQKKKKHRAYLLVRVKPGKDTEVLEGVRLIPQVLNADIVYGAADLIIHVTFDGFEELQQIVYNLVHSQKGIADTDTCFVSSFKDNS